jgi:hypothetical protein
MANDPATSPTISHIENRPENSADMVIAAPCA